MANIIGGGGSFGGNIEINCDRLDFRNVTDIDFGGRGILNFNVPTHTHGNNYIKDQIGQNIALSIYNDSQLVVRRNGLVVGQINFN